MTDTTPVRPSVTPTLATPPNIKLPRTIYDASALEVFGKNFLAGLGHGLGNVTVYILFVVLMAYLAVRYLLPIVQPYIKLYQQSMESLQRVQQLVPSFAGGQSGTQEGINAGESGQTTSGWNIQLNTDQIKSLLPK